MASNNGSNKEPEPSEGDRRKDERRKGDRRDPQRNSKSGVLSTRVGQRRNSKRRKTDPSPAGNP
jgi:hypothetical protein